MRSADTFLPLGLLRNQIFRTTASDEDADALLQANRASAISWVGKEAGFPVLDRREAVHKAAPSGGDSVLAFRPFVREVSALRYWSPGASASAQPDGTVLPVPRTVPLPQDSGIRVFAPAAGWPSMDSDGGLWITMLSGIPDDHSEADLLRQAGVCMTRFFLNAGRDMDEKNTARQLLRSVRDFLGGRNIRSGGWDGFILNDGMENDLTFGGEPVEVGGRRVDN